MCGLAEPIVVQPAEPEIEILSRDGRTFDERCPHPHDEVADAKGIESLEQRALSGSEDDVEHGSGHDEDVRKG